MISLFFSLACLLPELGYLVIVSVFITQLIQGVEVFFTFPVSHSSAAIMVGSLK